MFYTLPVRQPFIEEDSSTLWVMAGSELSSVDGKPCAVILEVNTLRDELVCPPVTYDHGRLEENPGAQSGQVCPQNSSLLTAWKVMLNLSLSYC